MSDLAIVGRQVGAEQRTFWRNPAAAGFTFVFPIMFLIIFSSLNGGGRLENLGNILFTEYYVPGIVAFSVVSACFTNLAINLVRQRDEGILKRKRGTPLPAWALVAGLLLSSIIVSFLLFVITTAIGMIVYHNAAPVHLVWLPFILVLGAVTFCALGVAITALIPNADAAPAIVNAVVFPLLFLSGLFFPIPDGVIANVSNLLPVRPFQQLLLAAFDPQHLGAGPHTQDLLVLAIWAVAGIAVAMRTFRWERRRA